jgi:hypothetical protein
VSSDFVSNVDGSDIPIDGKITLDLNLGTQMNVSDEDSKIKQYLSRQYPLIRHPPPRKAVE